MHHAFGGEFALAEFRREAVAQGDEDLLGPGAYQRGDRLAQVAGLGRLAAAVVGIGLEAGGSGVAVLGDPERAAEAAPGEKRRSCAMARLSESRVPRRCTLATSKRRRASAPGVAKTRDNQPSERGVVMAPTRT